MCPSEQDRPAAPADPHRTDEERSLEAAEAQRGAAEAEALVRDSSEERPAERNPAVVPKPPDEVGKGEAGPAPAFSSTPLEEAGDLLGGSNRTPGGRQLVLLAIGIVIVLVGNMIGQVRLNAWHGDFFDAIDRRGLTAFGQQLVVFLQIVGVLLVLVVAQTWQQEMMKVRLRQWLTHKLLDRWLVRGRAYRMAMTSEFGVNPDQRIQEDTRQLTDFTVELGVGLLQSAMLLVSFIGVLWALSSSVRFEIGGQSIVIPGYMVWCAIGYALLGSGLTLLVGRPLIALNAQRYAREADFRFALVRVSESAESIALYGGEKDERRVLGEALQPVILAMRRLSSSIARLTWITSGYGWLAIVVPILAAAPGYFSGRLSLGELMMVVGAFNQVQQALRWFVDNFPRIADWRAALGRVASFYRAMDEAEVEDDTERLEIEPHPGGALAFDRVGILLKDGHVVIKDATAEIRPGERVLIVGASGAGKSTLFRAIAGLWPWGTGHILLPPRATMMFMPQRPYLPLGRLRGAVTYPAGPGGFAAEAVEAALRRVGLGELVPMLDLDERWDRALSVGQQQRLAFARLLLHRPRWVFLDEATAALDEANQEVVMSIFDQELPEAAVVSIGHRPGLERFHRRLLELVPSPDGARLRFKPHPPDGKDWPLEDMLASFTRRRVLRRPAMPRTSHS